MKVNKLFLRKLLVAFVAGAAGSLIPKITELGPLTALTWTHAIWVSLALGGVTAGVRAVLVLVPGLNLVPSDSQPVITKTAPPAA